MSRRVGKSALAPVDVQHPNGVMEIGAELELWVKQRGRGDRGKLAARVLLVDPLAKAALFRLKTDVAASNVGLLSPATSTPTSPILGLQMIVSPFMPANSGLIVDPSNIVSATSTVDVAQSTDARFYEDAVVYRVVTRCGHAVVHADRLAKLSIGVAADD